MRLIRCTIENFGGLHHTSLEFNRDLTVLCETNGFGKTTLAEFIAAMFYGFPRNKRKGATDNLREKYAPWQGGVYGGSLEFTTGNQFYRIERSFGQTPKEDQFALFDCTTGQRSRDFREDLGQELFQIDADSFRRSTYLPQGSDLLHAGAGTDGGPWLTNDIQSKISNLVEDTDDINNYDTAMSRLRRARSALRPYRGNGGSMAELQQKINALQERIGVRSALENQALQAEQELQAIWEQWESLQNSGRIPSDAGTLEHPAEEDGPSAKMLEKGESLARELDMLNQQLELATFTPWEHQRYQELQVLLYPNGSQKDTVNIAAPHGAPTGELPDANEETASASSGTRERIPSEKRRWISVLLGSVALLIAGVLLLVLEPFQYSRILGIFLICLDAGCMTGLVTKLAFQRGKRAPKAPCNSQSLHPASWENPKERLSLLSEYQELHSRYRQIHDPTRGLHRRIDDVSYRLVQTLSPYLDEAEDLIQGVAVLRIQKKEFQEASLQRQWEAQMARQEKLQQQRLVAQETLEQLQQKLAELPGLEDQLRALTLELREQEHQLELLDATMDFLSQAKDSLSAMYTGPIQKSLTHYMSLLHPDHSAFTLDQELNVSIQENEMHRNLTAFSQGQQDKVLLCLRLALIDALFPGERPFLILDDPFVNLDDVRVREALNLLEALSQETQIVYLTCSESRI